MLIQLSLFDHDTFRRGDVVCVPPNREAIGVVARAGRDGPWVDVHWFRNRIQGNRITDPSVLKKIGSIFIERK